MIIKEYKTSISEFDDDRYEQVFNSLPKHRQEKILKYKEKIDKKKIHLPEPIRSLGVHEVTIKLHPQVTATLRVHVGEKN